MTDVSKSNDPLSALLSRKGARWRTIVVPQAKVMFIQVNKNACTSIKWMLAGVAGEDLDSFEPGLLGGTSPQDAIHDRTLWRKTPRLDALEPEVRAQIHPDNGWFVFAVTRDPRSRLFSAWQSKLLLENPRYTGYRQEPWYPRHPPTADTVVADFATFVDLLEREPAADIRDDGHFRDQTAMLHLDVVTYTRIYDIKELGQLQADLQRHLDSVGWAGTLRLPRFNDTPLRVNGQPFAGGVRERVEKVYAADFERFGDRWGDFSAVEAAPAWTAAELYEAQWRATFGHRIGDLRDRALGFRADAAAQRRRADRQTARARRLKARVEELERQQREAAPRPAASGLRRGARALRRRRGQH